VPPVCFVASGQIGGAERYLETLLEAMDRPGRHRAVVVGSGGFDAILEDLGLAVERVRYRGRKDLVHAAAVVRRTLRRDRPAVVHANGFVAATVAGLARIGTATPVMWLKVDMSQDGVRARTVARLCSEVAGMSEAAIRSVRGVSGVSARVVLGGIPELGVRAGDGREALRTACGWEDDVFGVVLSGRLCPGKGQLELVDAAPAVLREHPHARFAFIGRRDPAYPTFAREIDERVRALGVDHAVTLLEVESAREAISLVSGADVVAAPSIGADSGWREGFGLVVAEAMQIGVATVIYDSGSLPEVLGDCGITVAEGDRHGLERALVTLAAEPGMRADLAARAQRRVAEQFAISRAAADMCACYERLATA
jgi:glycosyltransferase involved in cell wall biosynthesis